MSEPRTDDLPVATSPGDAGSGDAGDIERQVRAAQIALVFNRARASNLVAPPVAGLVCWLLWDALDHMWLVAWWALLFLVMVWREALHRSFSDASDANTERLGRRYDLALFCDGLIYGLIGTLLLPRQDPALAAIMLATLVGIASVGLLVLSTSLSATLAFTLPALLPTIAIELTLGRPLAIYSGLAMAVFLILVAVEGRKASEHTRAMLRLRFQMDELASQRQQALALAQRSSAVKSQFLATMSHEMRTPLHGILGVTRLLRSARTDDDAKTRTQRLEMIERTGDHLLGLINDVLDYSKIEGGHLRLDPADFDLRALVESVGELTRVSTIEKGLALKVALVLPTPCWVRADASRLRQVLLNLIGNAVKFTDRGGVDLTVQREPDGVTTFEVIDTGPGIAEDQRELIFGAFHQADSSFGRRHGGTGLGLTISRELARALGGELVCVGAPTDGSCFVLTLPLPSAEPVARDPRPALPNGMLRGRVLVAEDNPVNALVAEALLQRSGLSVDVVVDGAQAVQRAAATRYDLILMDCQMPGMDGFEATTRIRATERARGASAVPIVALTANALESDRQRSIAAGMNEHLAKPFHEQELSALLRRFLS